MDERIGDAIDELAIAVRRVAGAITPQDAIHGRDEAGGIVGSLTESVMGITAALLAISRSISDLAEAIDKRTP